MYLVLELKFGTASVYTCSSKRLALLKFASLYDAFYQETACSYSDWRDWSESDGEKMTSEMLTKCLRNHKLWLEENTGDYYYLELVKAEDDKTYVI